MIATIQSGLSAALDLVGHALPELSLKAAIVLAIAAVFAFSLRRAPASARHLVWAAAAAGVLALPLAQLVPLRFRRLSRSPRPVPFWMYLAGRSRSRRPRLRRSRGPPRPSC